MGHRRRRWEEGEESVSKHRMSAWVWRRNELSLNGTAHPVSRDQILNRERGQGKFINVPCLAGHNKQDWRYAECDDDTQTNSQSYNTSVILDKFSC